MTEIRLDKVTQANLQGVYGKIAEGDLKTEMRPLLNGANVKVTDAPLDIEKLAAKLEVETNDEAQKVAKTSIGSSFSAVIARVLEKREIDESNMQVLNEAGEISSEIDALDKEIDQQQKQVDSLTKQLHEQEREVNSLNQQISAIDGKISRLDAQIAAEADPAKKAELEAQKEAMLDQKADLSAKLATAQAKLSMTQQILGETAEKMAEKMREKDVKKEALKKKLEELKDKELLDDIINALKEQKLNVRHLTEEKEAERSDAEEEWLEENSPVEVIRRMLDEIAEMREEKI